MIKTLLSQSDESYWYSTSYNDADVGIQYNVAVDSSGNIYTVVGKDNNTLGSKILKYDTNGNLLASKYLSLGSGTSLIQSICIDSDGYVYICGYYRYTSSGTSTQDSYIVKLNSDLNSIIWQKRYRNNPFTAGDYVSGTSLIVTGDGYLHFVGGYKISGFSAYKGYSMYLNRSDGSIFSKHALSPSGGGDFIPTISAKYESSLYTYICGYANISGADRAFITNTYSETLLVNWTRLVSSTNVSSPYNVTRLYGIYVDSSGNIYCCGGGYYTTSACFIIAKYNSSGTRTWIRTLVGESATALRMTSDGTYLYITGILKSSGMEQTVLVKYDFNGNLQYQKTLYFNFNYAYGFSGYGITNNFNNIFICGSKTNFYNSTLLKLPSNGSLTDMTDMTYEEYNGSSKFNSTTTTINNDSCALATQTSTFTLTSYSYSPTFGELT